MHIWVFKKAKIKKPLIRTLDTDVKMFLCPSSFQSLNVWIHFLSTGTTTIPRLCVISFQVTSDFLYWTYKVWYMDSFIKHFPDRGHFNGEAFHKLQTSEIAEEYYTSKTISYQAVSGLSFRSSTRFKEPEEITRRLFLSFWNVPV